MEYFIYLFLSAGEYNLGDYARIGQEMLMEEDYADDEIESELAPIAVQLAYVHQVSNKQRFCKCS